MGLVDQSIGVEGGGGSATDDIMMPEITERKQGNSQFPPGQSGNPAGRPKGARNKATLALETLLDGQAEALTQKAIELALGGDMMALRMCLDRILPARRDRPVSIEMVRPANVFSTRCIIACVPQALCLVNADPRRDEKLRPIQNARAATIAPARSYPCMD